jgi:hypothetical protein
MGYIEGKKKALNQLCTIFFPSLLLTAEHGFNIIGFNLFF